MPAILYKFVFFYVIYAFSLFFLSLVNLINPMSVWGAMIPSLLLSPLITKKIDSTKKNSIPFWYYIIFLPLLHLFFVPHFLRDDLIYHLYIPKRILFEGGMFIDTFNINTNFPYLFELPLMAVELISPFLTFNLVNLVILFVLCWLSLSLIEKWGEIVLPKSSCILFTIAFLTQPAIYRLCLSAYVELFLTLLIIMGFYHYHQYDRDGKPLDWYFSLSFLSIACSVKYIGLLFWGAVVLREYLVKKNHRVFFGGALFSIILLSPFYIKNYLATQNPFFPFGIALFPSDYLSVKRYLLFTSLLGSPKLNLESVLEPLSLFIGFFTSETQTTVTASCALSFLFLISFLGVGFKNRWQAYLSIVFCAYFLIWVTTSQQSRFLLPVLILLMPFAILQLSHLMPREKFKLVLNILLILTLIQNGFNNHTAMRDLKIYSLITGRMSSFEFRSHHNHITTHFAEITKAKLNPKKHKLWLIGNFGRAYDYDVPILAYTGFDTELISRSFERGKIRLDLLINFFSREQITHIQLDRKFFNNFYHRDENFDMEKFKVFLNNSTKRIYSYNDVDLIEIGDLS